MVHHARTEIDHLVIEHILAQCFWEMRPRLSRVFGTEDTVVVDGHYDGSPGGADGMQVHFVALGRRIVRIELEPMRQRDNAAAVAVLGPHGVAQVVRFGPGPAAVSAAQHHAVGHVRRRPARALLLMAGDASVHEHNGLAAQGRDGPPVVVAVAVGFLVRPVNGGNVHQPLAFRGAKEVESGRPWPVSFIFRADWHTLRNRRATRRRRNGSERPERDRWRPA